MPVILELTVYASLKIQGVLILIHEFNNMVLLRVCTSKALSRRFCSLSWFPFVKKSSEMTFGSFGFSWRALSIASSACPGWKLRQNKGRLDREKLI